MRSQESSVHLAMYKAMDVQAVAKPVSEVLSSLNTGIVTGFDNTPLFLSLVDEPVSHYTLTRHIYQPSRDVLQSFVDSLSPELKSIVILIRKQRRPKGGLL